MFAKLATTLIIPKINNKAGAAHHVKTQPIELACAMAGSWGCFTHTVPGTKSCRTCTRTRTVLPYCAAMLTSCECVPYCKAAATPVHVIQGCWYTEM